MKTLVVTFAVTSSSDVDRQFAEDLLGKTFSNKQALLDALSHINASEYSVCDLSELQDELNDTCDDYQSPILDGWISFVYIMGA